MQAIRETALQQAEQTVQRLREQLAWFYLRQIDRTEQSDAARVNALLTPSERAALPPPQGEAEKRARNGPCTRFALLEAQLCDTIDAYTKQFAMRDADTPETIRGQMNGRLDVFQSKMRQTLRDTLSACFRQNCTADETVNAVQQAFVKAVKPLAADVETYYTKASWHKLLRHLPQQVVECPPGQCEAQSHV